MGDPTKRFGVRYGRRIRKLYASIEIPQKEKHICPYCQYKKITRVAKGNYTCLKCKAKFTGKAYMPA